MLESTRAVLLLVSTLAAGCAPSAPPARVGATHDHGAREAAAPSDGPVRAERIAVAFDDVKGVAQLLEKALVESPNRGDLRAVLVDDRSGELIVFGTDLGIARARAFLSPGVVEAVGGDDVEVVKLSHAEAANVVRVVTPLVYGRIRIVPEPAMNALVMSGEADARARVKKIVESLDVPSGGAARAP